MHSFPFYLFLLVAGALTWVLGIFSRTVKRVIAPPLLMMLAGILLGFVIPQPQAMLLDYLEVLSWAAVGFGATSIALRFQPQDLRRIWRPGAVVTGIAMLGMWAASGFVIWLALDVPFTFAMVIGAVITPTDPVVASTIVTGPFAEKLIPTRLRYMLSFESGTNDGLGLAFLFLPLLLIENGPSGVVEWLYSTLLWKVAAAGLLGVIVGWAFGTIVKSALARGIIRERALLLASMTMTITLLALMKVLHMDSIWGTFIAVIVFSGLLPTGQRQSADEFQEAGTYITMVPALLVFGMALPWSDWQTYGPSLLVAVVAVLLFRRLPIVALLYGAMRRRDARRGEDALRRPFSSPRDFWFYGWFGPIGLSAIYYVTTAHRHLGDPQVWDIGSIFILASIVVHGVTASPFTRWYAKAGG